MTTGAAGAALFVKCRYYTAKREVEQLARLALKDGRAFEDYLRAKHKGEETTSSLRAATEIPLSAAELALRLLEQLPEARATCPRPMGADLDVGAHLLEASVRANLRLVKTNLRLFPEGWSEGETRLSNALARSEERERYRQGFQEIRTVAVIGISGNTDKPAYYVPAFLKARGYIIWGVRPDGRSELAERTATDLPSLGGTPDLVLLFRKSESISEHLDELLAVQPKVVWMQQGIQNEEVTTTLQARGVIVVSNRCAKLEFQRVCY